MKILKRMLREPLLHFLLIGAGLFWLFYEVADPDQERANQILVTKADVERLKTQWQRQWRRPPTEQELGGMIDAHIRETILYKEALALGLDQDDVIVRRRLGQKLEFLFKDLAEQAEPAATELERYLEEHGERYVEPGRYTFTHVYLNPDERGAALADDAQALLDQLQTGTLTVDADGVGDRFLYQYQFSDQTPAQIARIFGSMFAQNLEGLEPGQWRGPVESGYGLHLVFIEGKSEPRQPELAEIRKKVRWDLIADRRKEVDAAFYAELRQRYDIRIEEPEDTDEPREPNSVE